MMIFHNMGDKSEKTEQRNWLLRLSSYLFSMSCIYRAYIVNLKK